jgi:hypothetical protein
MRGNERNGGDGDLLRISKLPISMCLRVVPKSPSRVRIPRDSRLSRTPKSPDGSDRRVESVFKKFRPLGVYQQIDGPDKDTMRLREFCGSRSCFVVLRRALGSICNGHPASKVVDNQEVTKSKNSTNISFHPDRYLITRRSQVQILPPLPTVPTPLTSAWGFKR